MALDEVIYRRYSAYSDADRPAALTSLYGAIGHGRSQMIAEDPFKARRLHRLMAASPDERVQRQANAYSLELLRYDQTSPDSHPFATILDNVLPHPEPEGEYWDRVKIGFNLEGLGVEESAFLGEIIYEQFFDFDAPEEQNWLLQIFSEQSDVDINKLIVNNIGKARELLHGMATSDIIARKLFVPFKLESLLRREHEIEDYEAVSVTANHMMGLHTFIHTRHFSDSEGPRHAIYNAVDGNYLKSDIEQRFNQHLEELDY
ncbi:hypothetical protein [Nocardia bovistercoris]|uniref:Uncharacterized protein n=1 Tax=Nocardia bovistercoris TaxID=2785916 RepID=A0A931N673_9NOCA|nr:hypothetical protein [Nocardia bovistercoris]MBH0779393.1 hypothetical protein [Nocardia bovistercoris]